MTRKRKRVKIAGIPVEVMSEADLLRARAAAVKPIQACLRVADDPSAPAISARHAQQRQQLPCENCDHLCWFDPASGPGRLFVRLLCLQCVVAEGRQRVGETWPT